MAVTRWSSQMKTTDSSAKMQELQIPWQSIVTTHSTLNATGAAGMFGTGACKTVVSEANSSGLGGIAPASTDEIDFLVKLPNDIDVTGASYLDIYYQTVASATKGDRVGWTITYNAINPNASTQAVADATTTTGVTNPTSRVLATGVSETFIFKDTATIAASTFTADYCIHFQATCGTGCAEGEVILQNIVFRYQKAWM